MTELTNGDISEYPVPEQQQDVEMDETMETQDNGDYDDMNDCQEVEAMTPAANIPYDEHKLFVGGLSTDTTEQTLREYFSKYGSLTEVNLKTDASSGRSRGFAFLVFAEDDAVDKTLDATPHVIDNKEIDAKKAIPHALHQQMKNKTKKVFVGGVPTDMPEEIIRNYFAEFGAIEEVALVTEKAAGPKGEKKRRGFCFVTFENEDIAESACAKSFHKIEGAEVEVKRATPREQDNKRQNHYVGTPHFMGRGRGGGFPHPPGGGRGGHWAPYGGHAGYYSFYPPPPPYAGGGYMGGGYGGYNTYGGYAAYEPYGGGGRREDAGYNSRYGPMRSNFVHNSHHNHGHTHHHPYSR